MYTLRDLQECFKFAMDKNYNYVAVLVSNRAAKTCEVIIIDNKDIESKLNYYLTAYNEDLTLKTFHKIRITSFIYADTFDEIEYVLLNR